MVTADTYRSYHELVDSAAPRLRQTTEGPEWRLLENYLQRHLPAAPRGQERQIFIEPRLESGFPDAVIVYWNKKITEKWPTERRYLGAKDLRLLHHLYDTNGCDEHSLDSLFSGIVKTSLERLELADTIYMKGKKWYARSLEKNFAVRRLISIEAKIANWKRGIGQAALNRWFAPESYLLLPKMPSTSAVQIEAEALRVGILGGDGGEFSAIAIKQHKCLPQSYASWLFNEWAWRCAL